MDQSLPHVKGELKSGTWDSTVFSFTVLISLSHCAKCLHMCT